MDLNGMIQTLKKDSNYSKMGMIASHLGVVREFSLTGKRVRGIEIRFKRDMIEQIIRDIRNMPGIFHVLIEISEGRLLVGDEIMAVMVGGDTREHVFPALIAAVDRIKREASEKREIDDGGEG